MFLEIYSDVKPFNPPSSYANSEASIMEKPLAPYSISSHACQHPTTS